MERVYTSKYGTAKSIKNKKYISLWQKQEQQKAPGDDHSIF